MEEKSKNEEPSAEVAPGQTMEQPRDVDDTEPSANETQLPMISSYKNTWWTFAVLWGAGPSLIYIGRLLGGTFFDCYKTCSNTPTQDFLIGNGVVITPITTIMAIALSIALIVRRSHDKRYIVFLPLSILLPPLLLFAAAFLLPPWR